jgi:hypothetical protein
MGEAGNYAAPVPMPGWRCRVGVKPAEGTRRWRGLMAAARALDLVTLCHSPVFRMTASMRLGSAWSPTQAYGGAAASRLVSGRTAKLR